MKTICSEKKPEPVPSRRGKVILLAAIVLMIGCISVPTAFAAEYDVSGLLSDGKIIKKPCTATSEDKSAVMVDYQGMTEKAASDLRDEPPNIMATEDAVNELIEAGITEKAENVESENLDKSEASKESDDSDSDDSDSDDSDSDGSDSDEEGSSDDSELLAAPLSSITISSPFGPRWGRMHEGIDFAHTEGGEIMAADDGMVSFSGYNGGYGNFIKLNHGEGVQTCYAHCSSLLVNEGQKVKRGEVIALVGSTGNSTGPHLHFEVIVNDSHVNPAEYTELDNHVN